MKRLPTPTVAFGPTRFHGPPGFPLLDALASGQTFPIPLRAILRDPGLALWRAFAGHFRLAGGPATVVDPVAVWEREASIWTGPDDWKRSLVFEEVSRRTSAAPPPDAPPLDIDAFFGRIDRLDFGWTVDKRLFLGVTDRFDLTLPPSGPAVAAPALPIRPPTREEWTLMTDRTPEDDPAWPHFNQTTASRHFVQASLDALGAYLWWRGCRDVARPGVALELVTPPSDAECLGRGTRWSWGRCVDGYSWFRAAPLDGAREEFLDPAAVGKLTATLALLYVRDESGLRALYG